MSIGVRPYTPHASIIARVSFVCDPRPPPPPMCSTPDPTCNAQASAPHFLDADLPLQHPMVRRRRLDELCRSCLPFLSPSPPRNTMTPYAASARLAFCMALVWPPFQPRATRSLVVHPRRRQNCHNSACGEFCHPSALPVLSLPLQHIHNSRGAPMPLIAPSGMLPGRASLLTAWAYTQLRLRTVSQSTNIRTTQPRMIEGCSDCEKCLGLRMRETG